jgi:hypothetical protein
MRDDGRDSRWHRHTAQGPSIVITVQNGDHRVQLGISHRNLMDVWQALAATGAAT